VVSGVLWAIICGGGGGVLLLPFCFTSRRWSLWGLGVFFFEAVLLTVESLCIIFSFSFGWVRFGFGLGWLVGVLHHERTRGRALD